MRFVENGRMAEGISIEEVQDLHAMGYITICAGGDIEVIKKEQNND